MRLPAPLGTHRPLRHMQRPVSTRRRAPQGKQPAAAAAVRVARRPGHLARPPRRPVATAAM
eukprot:285989-Chlamydomonas_euryale.AAC.1